MAIKLTGTFSLNMLSTPSLATIQVTELPIAAVKSMDLDSHIGSDITAVLLSKCLGKNIPRNRQSVSLCKGDSLLHAMTLNKLGNPLESIEQADQLVYGVHYTFRFYLVEVL